MLLTPKLSALLAAVLIVQAHGSQDHGHVTDEHGEPNYQYRYGVADHKTGDIKGAWEKRAGPTVWGAYWLRDADGLWRTVHYNADKTGFHAVVNRRPIYRRRGKKGGKSASQRQEDFNDLTWDAINDYVLNDGEKDRAEKMSRQEEPPHSLRQREHTRDHLERLLGPAWAEVDNTVFGSSGGDKSSVVDAKEVVAPIAHTEDGGDFYTNHGRMDNPFGMNSDEGFVPTSAHKNTKPTSHSAWHKVIPVMEDPADVPAHEMPIPYKPNSWLKRKHPGTKPAQTESKEGRDTRLWSKGPNASWSASHTAGHPEDAASSLTQTSGMKNVALERGIDFRDEPNKKSTLIRRGEDSAGVTLPRSEVVAKQLRASRTYPKIPEKQHAVDESPFGGDDTGEPITKLRALVRAGQVHSFGPDTGGRRRSTKSGTTSAPKGKRTEQPRKSRIHTAVFCRENQLLGRFV